MRLDGHFGDGDRIAYQIPGGPRALQVLDGLAAGASQRELAIAIFGSAAGTRG